MEEEVGGGGGGGMCGWVRKTDIIGFCHIPYPAAVVVIRRHTIATTTTVNPTVNPFY